MAEYLIPETIENEIERVLATIQEAFHEKYTGRFFTLVVGEEGSGKSSLLKFLCRSLDWDLCASVNGLADSSANKFRSTAIETLFRRVADDFSPMIIFMNLAKEISKSDTAQDLLTVLHAIVLDWAGYSKDAEIAGFERMLEKDGKFDHFKARAEVEMGGVDWFTVHDQVATARQIASRLAPEFYPQLMNSPLGIGNGVAFSGVSIQERVEDLMDVIQQKSGRSHVVFAFDDVDQYLSCNIMNALHFSSLLETLAYTSKGVPWVIATTRPYVGTSDVGVCKVLDKFVNRVLLDRRYVKQFSQS